MARILVNPRIGVLARPKQPGSLQRDMKDIRGVFDMMVYDTVLHRYFPAVKSDLPG